MKKFLATIVMALVFLCISKYDAFAYTVDNNTVYVDGAGQVDITGDLNSALLYARDNATSDNKITVKVKSGNYNLTGCLHIYSNTTLDLTEGVTLTYSNDASYTQNMILCGTNGSYKGQSNYNNSDKCRGYDGFENITIKGGIWIGSQLNTAVLFRFAHARNVTLEGVTITGGAGLHQVEVAAIDGFYVRGCTFKDFIGAYENGKKMEALQLDTPCSTTTFKSYYLDGTILKNVEITGCTFDNVPRGIGTHSMLLGEFHDGIKINNNTFNNIYEEAVICLGYKNCEIKDNVFTNCAAGIIFQAFNDKSNDLYTTIFDGVACPQAVENNVNTVISGNTINVVYSDNCSEIVGIKVMGLKLDAPILGKDGQPIAAGDYFVTGVNVSNNNVTTAGYGIRFLDAKNCAITGNTIKSFGISGGDISGNEYDGVHLAYESTDTNVSGNNISLFPRNGVYLRAASSAAVNGNAISNCNSNGISLFTDCTASQVSQNSISGCVESAIKASTRCTLGEVTLNTIKNIQNEAGIVVYNCSAAGSVSQNDISTDACYGLKVSSSSICGSINANTFRDSQKNAIYVLSNSTVNGGISANTFTSVKSPINICATQNDIVIDGNVVKEAYSNIFIIDTKQNGFTTTVSNNSLSGNKTSTAIWIKSGKFNASGNTIAKVKKGIVTQSGVKGEIMDNKFSSTVKTPMNVNGKKSYSFAYKRVVAKKLEKRNKGYNCTITWSKYNLANKYEIQYSRKSDFSKGVKTVVAGKNRDNVTIKNLKKNGTYYVRIRAINVLNGVKIYNPYGVTKKIDKNTKMYSKKDTKSKSDKAKNSKSDKSKSGKSKTNKSKNK